MWATVHGNTQPPCEDCFFAIANDRDKLAPRRPVGCLKDKRQPNRDPEVSLGASEGTSLSPPIPVSMRGRRERRWSPARVAARIDLSDLYGAALRLQGLSVLRLEGFWRELATSVADPVDAAGEREGMSTDRRHIFPESPDPISEWRPPRWSLR